MMGKVSLAAVFLVSAFAACGGDGESGTAPGGASATDGGSSSSGSSGSSGSSSGSSVWSSGSSGSSGSGDGGADAAADVGAGADADVAPAACTRAAEAKTAPASLYDALKSDLAGLAAGAKSARIDTFLAAVAAQGGTPLEDPKTGRTIFLARGAGPYAIVGSFGDFDPANGIALTQVTDTDLWTLDTAAFTTSITYRLFTTDLVDDPLARTVVWDGVVRDGAQFNLGQFNAVARPALLPMTQGRLTVHGAVHATQLNNDHEIFVYFPPKYDDGTCAKLPTITFQDGNESLAQGGYASLADGIYAADPTLSAVLVFAQLPPGADFNERTNEYVATKVGQYEDFLTTDLWPAISGGYRVCSKAAARGISGVSYGGVLATSAAFDKPTTWGWVGAQSASYWYNSHALAARVTATDPKIDVRFYIDSSDQAADNYYDVEDMKTKLAAKAYVYTRVTVPVVDAKPHDFKYFKLRLPQLLTDFRSGVVVCD